MKKIWTLGVLFWVLIAALAPWTAAAGTKDVAVLYHGTTETNRETMNFMKKVMAQENGGWTLHFVANPSDVKPGQYKAVIVLNTGLTSGLDPYFADFLKTYPTKKEVFLVSMIKDSQQLVLTHTPADPKNNGVDTITAASVWSRSQTGTNPQFANGIEMHVAWVKQILQNLKTL